MIFIFRYTTNVSIYFRITTSHCLSLCIKNERNIEARMHPLFKCFSVSLQMIRVKTSSGLLYSGASYDKLRTPAIHIKRINEQIHL